MKNNNTQSRRNFLGMLATGALASGVSFIPNSLLASDQLKGEADFLLKDLDTGADKLEAALQKVGNMKHPVCYDISQAIPWGIIWSNVYYMTNKQTGTAEQNIGMLNVLRHHGMYYAMNDDVIAKYKLGEFFHVEDPTTKAMAMRNPYYEPTKGTFPVEGLSGIKGLQEIGAKFCVCDMARKVNAMFIAQKMNADQETVYQDLVDGTLPGIMPAPSGVWVLGRLAENKIAYIDASVG